MANLQKPIETPNAHSGNNRLLVTYPNGQSRVRNVLSTAYPTRQELGYITDINMWFLHIRMVTDAIYNAHHAIDTVVATDMLIDNAREILNIPPNPCSHEAD